MQHSSHVSYHAHNALIFLRPAERFVTTSRFHVLVAGSVGGSRGGGSGGSCRGSRPGVGAFGFWPTRTFLLASVTKNNAPPLTGSFRSGHAIGIRMVKIARAGPDRWPGGCVRAPLRPPRRDRRLLRAAGSPPRGSAATVKVSDTRLSFISPRAAFNVQVAGQNACRG
jgi:hypothetical protein